MAFRNPSDTYRLNMGRFARDTTVGEARDFLDKPYVLLRPIKLLKISRGLSRILHHEIDYEAAAGLPVEHLLPEELDRRAELGKQMIDEIAAKRTAQAEAEN